MFFVGNDEHKCRGNASQVCVCMCMLRIITDNRYWIENRRRVKQTSIKKIKTCNAVIVNDKTAMTLILHRLDFGDVFDGSSKPDNHRQSFTGKDE